MINRFTHAIAILFAGVAFALALGAPAAATPSTNDAHAMTPASCACSEDEVKVGDDCIHPDTLDFYDAHRFFNLYYMHR